MSVTLMTLAVSETDWTPAVGVTMLACILFAVAIGKFAIQRKGEGPSLGGLPAMFEGFGVPELLATASFGHILGAGVVLGLRSSGVF